MFKMALVILPFILAVSNCVHRLPDCQTGQMSITCIEKTDGTYESTSASCMRGCLFEKTKQKCGLKSISSLRKYVKKTVVGDCNIQGKPAKQYTCNFEQAYLAALKPYCRRNGISTTDVTVETLKEQIKIGKAEIRNQNLEDFNLIAGIEYEDVMNKLDFEENDDEEKQLFYTLNWNMVYLNVIIILMCCTFIGSMFGGLAGYYVGKYVIKKSNQEEVCFNMFYLLKNKY